MKKEKIIFCLIAVCLHLALFEGEGLSAIAGTALPEPSYPILRNIQYGFAVRNKTNRLLKEAEFWTYGPVKQTSTQRCVKLDMSHPYQLILDDLGNQILYFRLENLPPHATRLITIKASLELSDTSNPSPLPNVEPFLRSEKYIESGHPEIAQLARKFESATPRKTAESMFRWVADNIHYTGYLRNSQGALYALRKKRGDCTEYMYLFTALCRANKIPARGIGGYVCSESSILNPASYHNWAEFYEEGAWRISDPQENVFMERLSHYIAMRIIGDSSRNPMGEFNRFRFAGDDVDVKMKTWTEAKGT